MAQVVGALAFAAAFLASTAALADEAPRSRTDATQWKVGWGIVGGGGAATLAGIVTGILTIVENEEVEELCTDETCPDHASLELSDRVEDLAAASTGLVVGGLLVMGVGMLIAFTTPTPGPRAHVRLEVRPRGVAVTF